MLLRWEPIKAKDSLLFIRGGQPCYALKAAVSSIPVFLHLFPKEPKQSHSIFLIKLLQLRQVLSCPWEPVTDPSLLLNKVVSHQINDFSDHCAMCTKGAG